VTPLRRALEPHPDFPGTAVHSLTVEVAREAGRLNLRYILEGRLSELRIPPRARPARADELWKHTCFEAFVRPPGDDAYWEFNLSPSTEWQAYGFSRYRERGPEPKTTPPGIEIATVPRFELRASLDLARLKGPWQVSLTAVIEDRSGGKSYWALRHPPGKPDFHHARGFALTLDPE
jgi:hypothetical protein